MGSDIHDTVWARRAFVAHCSLLALGLAGSGPAGAQARAPTRTLLVLGDSLSAEYGIARGAGWVALLQTRIDDDRLAWRVVNASISGDTTSGGRSRLPALLTEYRPALVIVELGGNDALRGLPLDMTEANLREMVRAARASGARVLVAGVAVPPNYGRTYSDAFAGLFAKVAKAEGAALVPFLLAGVADGPDPYALFQPDRIHPKAEAHPRILENVWRVLRPLLR